MSHYSCLKIISTKAKKMARASSVLTHSQALEIIAKQSSFSNYHELTRVAKYAPLEPRLLMAAFGDSDFADVIHNYYDTYTDGPYTVFEMAVEHELSGEIASTNANDFTVEDLTVTETHYDENKGILNLMVRKLNHRFKILLTMNFISLWGLIARDRGIYGEKMLFRLILNLKPIFQTNLPCGLGQKP
ncbi:hypothetical protein ACI2JI_24515 [Enterobacter cancerogenus]|uniref:hypothetical protein n=1 Tax=Enterobacter cancerogenus TaxID=69218 RepID=UPI00384B5691